MKDSTTALSDLPLDLVEEVISKVPLTSLRAVRTTCKNWNGLFKHRRSFTKKHIRKSRAATKKREFMAIIRINASVDLMSFNFRGLDNDDDVETFINRKAKFISLNDGDGVDDIYSVSHCGGLLLCSTTGKKNSRLMVLNPYRGQTRWIEPIDHECYMDSYALGYEKKKMNSRRCHKILRSMEMNSMFIYDIGYMEERSCKYQIYNFNSDSWKDIHLTPNRHLRVSTRDVSLKGNTYWLVRWETNWFIKRPLCKLSEREFYRERVGPKYSLLCFDFTTERFGPPLDLPFHSRQRDNVCLSSVREEQLAVLCQRSDTLEMEIWISNKIEPEAASWSKLFVALNLKTRLTCLFDIGRFFVDKGKKVVVVFCEDQKVVTGMHWAAYLIGEDGCSKKVVFGEFIYKHGCPVIMCPYVPSSVQIKQATPRGNHVD